MQRFRKRPLIIEAEQFFTEKRPWPQGVIWSDGKPCVMTQRGPFSISNGDWVIKGIDGKYYPMNRAIFDESYERIDSDNPGK